MTLPEAKNNMFPFFPDVHGAPFNGMEAMSYLTRWTVDLASNSEDFESVTKLTDTAGEFPRIDDRMTGLPYRYGWMLVIDPTQPVELKGGSAGGMIMNTLGMVDHKTGKEQKRIKNISDPYQLGFSPDLFCHEPQVMEAPAAGLLPGISGLQLGIVAAFEADPLKAMRVKVLLPGIDAKAGAALPGVKQVDVLMTFDPPWGMDMMSDEARLELGFM